MAMKSSRLTQVGVDKMKAPQTGRFEIRDLVVPGMRLRVSDTGLKSYSLITRYRGDQVRVPCGKHGAVTLAEAA